MLKMSSHVLLSCLSSMARCLCCLAHRFWLLGKELVALVQNLGCAHAQQHNDDDPQHEPGGIDWANHVERGSRQGHKLEVDNNAKQDKRYGWQDHMLPHVKLTAVLAPVAERHRQTSCPVDEQDRHCERRSRED